MYARIEGWHKYLITDQWIVTSIQTEASLKPEWLSTNMVISQSIIGVKRFDSNNIIVVAQFMFISCLVHLMANKLR